MPTNNYEKYIGYSYEELNYKKEMVRDSITGIDVERLVKRTPEEKKAYKSQKELEFNDIVATWERLGIKRCAWEREFDEKRFNKIYLKLIDNELEQISNANPRLDIENRMVNVIDNINNKYHISSALGFYSVKDNDYISPDKIFKGMSKNNIEDMFYQKISIETAEELARNRLSNSTTAKEGFALIQELQKTHNSRSIFFKIFHPFKNADERRLIGEMKNEVMQKFNISREDLNAGLRQEIDKLSLNTSSLYKVDDFVNSYCIEKSGKLYSQREIDMDEQTVDRRAEDDFVETQMAYDQILNENVRESIVVDEANGREEMERSEEQSIEDPNIIRVPNNNKF